MPEPREKLKLDPRPEAPKSAQQRPALIALVLGIFAIILAGLPIVGLVLGIIGIIFGTIALRRGQSKGLAVTGVVLSGLAAIASLIATITMLPLVGQMLGVVEEVPLSERVNESQLSGSSDAPGGGGSGAGEPREFSPTDRIDWFDLDTANAPVSTHAGTEDDPHPIGSSFTIDGWEVVVNFIDTDAEESLRQLEPQNAAPQADERFVLMNITANNRTDQEASFSGVKMTWETSMLSYPAHRTQGYALTTPDPDLIDENRRVTGNFSGYVALRTSDVDGKVLRITGSDSDEKVYVGVD